MAQSNIQISFGKKDRYKETRERICKYNSQYKNCSDKEIIEYLADEIEHYRNRLKELEDKKENYAETKIVGYNNKLYEVTRWFEDGILIKEEAKPCRETIEFSKDRSTCPPIKPGFTVSG